MAAFLAHQPFDAIRSYGHAESMRGENGDRIVLLPSRTVPARFLDRTTWDRKIPMGNFRSVYSVDTTTDGEKPGLVVKTAERLFTTDKRKLAKGDIWWSGPRSFDKPIRVHDPSVDVQTLWEAAYLLELWQRGIPAEVPQGIIIEPNDRVSLVVNNIDNWPGRRRGPSHSDILRRVGTETTLQPVDATEYNFLEDENGYGNIIDVNRWRWPPHTDTTMHFLTAAVQREIDKSN